MNQIKLFIDLIRLKKPIGFMLLFWPCAWGLTLAYDFTNDKKLYFSYLLLFFLGSILMRSAGCIVNDISDKEFDQKVSRTKNRSIASGKITIKLAIIYTFCSVSSLRYSSDCQILATLRTITTSPYAINRSTTLLIYYNFTIL